MGKLKDASEHSLLLPPQLCTVLLQIFTASKEAENFSGQH